MSVSSRNDSPCSGGDADNASFPMFFEDPELLSCLSRSDTEMDSKSIQSQVFAEDSFDGLLRLDFEEGIPGRPNKVYDSCSWTTFGYGPPVDASASDTSTKTVFPRDDEVEGQFQNFGLL